MGQPVPGAQTSEGQNHMQQAITQVIQLNMGFKQKCLTMITNLGFLIESLLNILVCMFY